MIPSHDFSPGSPIIAGHAHPECRASIIIPARNEEANLASTLDAFATQVDTFGHRMNAHHFEILLLLNNCTDRSAQVACEWKTRHPAIALHIIDRVLEPEDAHVGMARRLLMDTAWHRLRQPTHRRNHLVRGILSTDADTVVAPDWIAQNLAALANGSDAVGGSLRLMHTQFTELPSCVQRAYHLDQKYQLLMAKLEDLLDPQEGDPWPRHLEHYGASLACTPEAYAASGGMPPFKHLEDVAFVDALRRADAILRHEPSVVVYTSCRFDGRAEVGLSYQLGEWQRMSERHQPRRVPSASWLMHRFRTLARLRAFHRSKYSTDFRDYSLEWSTDLKTTKRQHTSTARFLLALDCDRLVHETFKGVSHGQIEQVNWNLRRAIKRIEQQRPAAVTKQRERIKALSPVTGTAIGSVLPAGLASAAVQTA